MSLKEQLIKEVADRLSLSISSTEKIVSHQFKDMLRSSHTCSEIELSGFGKFLVSPSKTKRRIQELEKVLDYQTKQLEQSTTEGERARWQYRSQIAQQKLTLLLSKLKGYEASL